MDLHAMRGWVFDLDGVIWAGQQLLPGAAEFVGALRESGRKVLFLTNHSMANDEGLVRRLGGHGIAVTTNDVLCPIDAAGHTLMEKYGPMKVLATGVPELFEALHKMGHTTVDDPFEAQAVVFGRSLDFSYADLVKVCRAVDRGVPFLTLNNDAYFPVDGWARMPGLGALVAAVTTATGRQVEVVGKPSPLLFQTALERLGTSPAETVMVGDTPDADIAGGLGVGMWTVLLGGATHGPQPHMRAANLAELHALMFG